MLKAMASNFSCHYRLKKERERFQYYYDSVHTDGKMMYVGLLLQRSAHLFPQNCALICKEQQITYQELYQKAVAVSKKLIAMGVQPGDRVILLFENSVQFYIAYYGIWQAGAVVVPLNTFLHEKELVHIIENAQPRLLIISQQFAERLSSHQGQLPPIISEQELETLSVSEQEAYNFKIPCLQENDVAALLYTSGTTGFPKGVMLSSKNIITNLVQGVSHINVSNQDKILAALPLFHSFAQNSCVWGSIFVGGTTIIVPRIERKLLLEAINKNPTIVAGIPALYGLFCLMKNVPFRKVRYFVCGGDALPDKIRMGFEIIYRRRLCNGYGLTETAPLISVNFDDMILPTNTVGRPAIGVECSLRDEQGNEVKHGQKGILWVKGDNVMLGYYRQPELTAQVMKNGWFDTGDWAYFDDKNRLVISGRHKDLIIHKGINIYPQEIENILMGHSLVIQAAVVGKKDVSTGEIPVAFVVLKSPDPLIEETLKNLCKQHLAAYKMPKQIYVLSAEEMPLTALKKVDKKKLRLKFLSSDND